MFCQHLSDKSSNNAIHLHPIIFMSNFSMVDFAASDFLLTSCKIGSIEPVWLHTLTDRTEKQGFHSMMGI